MKHRVSPNQQSTSKLCLVQTMYTSEHSRSNSYIGRKHKLVVACLHAAAVLRNLQRSCGFCRLQAPRVVLQASHYQRPESAPPLVGTPKNQFAALWDDDHFPGLPYHCSEAVKGQNSGIFNIHANCSNEVCTAQPWHRFIWLQKSHARCLKKAVPVSAELRQTITYRPLLLLKQISTFHT